MCSCEEERKKQFQNIIDYELCARCSHFYVCHRGRCEAWVEGDRDDLIVECDCTEFVHSPRAGD